MTGTRVDPSPSVVHVQWNGNVGGIARVVVDLARAQLTLGTRVGLAFGRAEGPFAEPSASSDVDAVLDLGFASGYDLRPWRLARARALLRKWDVVHLHGFNLPLGLAALGSGRPIVFTDHGSLPAGWRRAIVAAVKGRLLGVLLKSRAAAVAANSRHTARLTSRLYRVPPDQVSVVYNGLSAARHDAKRATPEGNELTVVFVGRLVHFKRVDRILEAAATITPGARVRFRIVGGGPLESEMRARARELSLGGSVEFVGVRDDVPRLLAEADVLLLPSQGEPFGLAIIEGCAQGLLPIVFADGGGALEILPPDGLVVGAPNELARQLVDLVGSPALSPEAREARSSWALERFSIDRTARAYGEMYRAATRAKPRKGRGRQSLLFLAPGDVGKGRVEPISWMRTCLAFAERGLDVSLLTLSIRRPDAVPTGSVWQHFGIRPAFRIRKIPTSLRSDSSTTALRLFGLIGTAACAVALLLRQALRPRRAIVYARAPFLLAPFGITRLLPASRRPKLVLETHTLPARTAARVARRVDLLVVTSDKLRKDAQAQLGLGNGRILHAPLGPFNEIHVHDKREARAALGLPLEAVIGCYAGKMIEDQTEFLLRAAAEIRDRVPGFRLLLVGGNPEMDVWTRRRASELGVADVVIAPGFVEPPQVELYQAAADVLVFHMSESLSHFDYCTPAKGFEYQAAGRPIVATDIPLFDEVFGTDGDRAIRVRERTPSALATGVHLALSLEDGGRAMTGRAAQWVSRRTWQARADAVLTALEQE